MHRGSQPYLIFPDFINGSCAAQSWVQRHVRGGFFGLSSPILYYGNPPSCGLDAGRLVRGTDTTMVWREPLMNGLSAAEPVPGPQTFSTSSSRPSACSR